MRLLSLLVLAVTLGLCCFARADESAPNGDLTSLDNPDEQTVYPHQEPFVRRLFISSRDGQWIGNGICYGPHRQGQSPEGEQPTTEQLLEDLRIMGRHWKMLRMYGSGEGTQTVLDLIKEYELDLRVVVGAWLGPETRVDTSGVVVEQYPNTRMANQEQVNAAIRLANAYPDLVAAITIGNETQVYWSFHPMREQTLIHYLRQARAMTSVPVSTADVSTYWAKPKSRAVADEVDFIVTHIYAMWNRQALDTALAWTEQQYADGVAQHPDQTFVIGEAGWATSTRDGGDDGEQIIGEASEAAQRTFYNDFMAWTMKNNIPSFFFEAFDENWKGGSHPDEAEKHWGLYHADRTPKAAVDVK